MIFFNFRGKGEREKGMGRGECKLGIWGVCKLPASYQQVRGGWLDGGDKSGIWRFYRRVWKNIFYERRDKERKRGVWGEMEGRSYIFLKSFEGWRRIRNFMGECIFGLWGGEGEKGGKKG